MYNYIPSRYEHDEIGRSRNNLWFTTPIQIKIIIWLT